MSTLQRAIAIAVEAHGWQQDKGGGLYILHPLRVMLAQETDEARIVAVLHDVVEDCPAWTFARLRAEGFSEMIPEALAAVTKMPDGGEDYPRFIARAASNPIARVVKLADLRDNCDLSRIASPTPKDYARIEKYRLAIAQLEGKGREGH